MSSLQEASEEHERKIASKGGIAGFSAHRILPKVLAHLDEQGTEAAMKEFSIQLNDIAEPWLTMIEQAVIEELEWLHPGGFQFHSTWRTDMIPFPIPHRLECEGGGPRAGANGNGRSVASGSSGQARKRGARGQGARSLPEPMRVHISPMMAGFAQVPGAESSRGLEIQGEQQHGAESARGPEIQGEQLPEAESARSHEIQGELLPGAVSSSGLIAADVPGAQGAAEASLVDAGRDDSWWLGDSWQQGNSWQQGTWQQDTWQQGTWEQDAWQGNELPADPEGAPQRQIFLI